MTNQEILDLAVKSKMFYRSTKGMYPGYYFAWRENVEVRKKIISFARKIQNMAKKEALRKERKAVQITASPASSQASSQEPLQA